MGWLSSYPCTWPKETLRKYLKESFGFIFLSQLLKHLKAFRDDSIMQEKLIELCTLDTSEEFMIQGHPVSCALRTLQGKLGDEIANAQFGLINYQNVEESLFEHLLDVLICDPPSPNVYEGVRTKKGSVRRSFILSQVAKDLHQLSLFKGVFEQRLAAEVGIKDST